MQLYYNIFNLLLKHEYYTKYYHLIKKENLKENFTELYKIHQVLPYLHQEAKDYTVDDLQLVFKGNYPLSKDDVYTPIFDQIRQSVPDHGAITSYLQSLQTSEVAQNLATLFARLSVSPRDDEVRSQIFQNLSVYQGEARELQDASLSFVQDELETLLESEVITSGLRWRLDSLNKSLGSLRPGNFGIVFARPESGKTTFLASEITAMAEQAFTLKLGPVLWFNNEEAGNKVQLRIIQGTFGVNIFKLQAQKKEYQEKYNKDKEKHVKLIDNGHMEKKLIESYVKAYKPSMIVIDQLDKIEGFKADREDLEHKERYIWARALAKTYNMVVIGVCQASASGENKRFLVSTDMDASKTSKAAEADFILGIGRVDEFGKENHRFFHLSKNKLYGDSDTDPDKKHHKWTVRIKPQEARYEDIV